MQKLFRDFRKQMDKLGLQVVDIRETGKHKKAIIRSPNGRETTYFLSTSPSDFRTEQNRNHRILRALR